MVELHCDMYRDCAEPVTMIDAKSFIYCAEHGVQRQFGQRCRKLRPHELNRLRQRNPAMTERNAALFNQIADVIEAHPERYRQHVWGGRTECGTYACIAGHALICRYGDSAFVPDANTDTGFRLAWDWAIDGSGPGGEDASYSDPGAYENITTHAARLLGLSYGEASFLFDGDWVPNGDNEDADVDQPAESAVVEALRNLAEGAVEALRNLAEGAEVDEVGFHF